MFAAIFRFELSYRARRPATYIYGFILFLWAFISQVYGWGPGNEKALITSPYRLLETTAYISIVATMLASAIMGVPIYRDVEHDTRGYYLSYPITERGYLLGRYVGSFLVLVGVVLCLHLGMLVGGWVGPFVGEQPAERYGAFPVRAFWQALLVLVLPNLFFVGTLFFCLVALTRKVFVAYTGSVLFLIATLLALVFSRDIERRTLAGLIEPFGYVAFVDTTRYWTIAEQNARLLPLEGAFLWNRLLWGGVALVVLAFTLARFSFPRFMATASGKVKHDAERVLPARPTLALPRVHPIFAGGTFFREMFRLAWLEFTNVVRDVYFLAILLGGVLFLFLDGWFGSPTYGTPSLPMTYYMLEVKDFNYIIFVYILLIFYTGEVVHRDRAVHFNQIADALPVPDWTVWGSKLLAMVYVCLLLVNLPLLTGVLNQVLAGHYEFEFDKYVTDLYLNELPEYLELTMLTFAVHVLVNNKFPGHVVSIGIWSVMFGLRNFAEMDYNLFFYSYVPQYKISDMNGFGHFLKPLAWFNGYWLALGGVLVTLAGLFWARGTETTLRTRLALARQRLTPASIAALTGFTALWLGIGAYLYYNVSVLNTYLSADDSRDEQAKFERRYKRLERALQPKITDVRLFADVFPDERRARVRAVCRMTNKWNRPIDTLYVVAEMPLKSLQIDNVALKPFFRDTLVTRANGSFTSDGSNTGTGFLWYKLPKTLQPGDTVTLETLTETAPRGFPNSGLSREVVYNGTFFSGGVPSFGYDPRVELISDKERKKRKLPETKYTAPPQNDSWGLGSLLFNDDADYITYDAVVSTAPDQLAVSPGYLQRSWMQNGRKYYHYTMEGKMDMFFNVVSARYAVKRDVWRGPDGRAVNIELFYHPKHTYNLDRFVKSVKASMDYFNANFTPYQYRQMRILEFPRYAGFAQSFPNTVPYSEDFAWVGNFKNPDKTDYLFYVTSHEVAHQWWGHQVTPSNTRGANQLSETMAEYSALMVQKKEFGNDAMQKFLRYGLDRYLRGRAGERKFEETLMQNDSRPYVWYDKGSLVMYALADYVGEANLNRGLRNFLAKAAFRPKAPFATTGEFYPYLEAVTPDSLRYFLEDGWKKIALYENSTVSATYTRDKGDDYRVRLVVDTKKIYYDGQGAEAGQGKGRNYIEIGILAEDGKNSRGMTVKKPLYLQKHWLTPGRHTLEFTVRGKPAKAGIDPYNKLIDRVPDDNVKSVEEG